MKHSWRRRRNHGSVRALLLAALSALALVVAAAPASATPVLVSAVAEVVVDESGSADVEMQYQVSGGVLDDGPAETISFSALTFGEAAAEDIEVLADDGEPLETSVDTVGLKKTVTVDLPMPLASGDELSLVARYRIPHAGTVDGDELNLAAPMLALDFPPAATTAGVFSATVTLPSGYEYVAGFPSTPAVTSAQDAPTEVRYEVAAMVSVLRTQATTGSPPLLTLQSATELLLLALIVLAVAVCIGYFLRQRRLAQSRPGERPDLPDPTPENTVLTGPERSR